MVKPEILLSVVLLFLFAACAGPKPVAERDITVEEVDGIRTRADSANRELEAEINPARSKGARSQNKAIPKIAPAKISTAVKIVKETTEFMLFEAVGEGSSTKDEPPRVAERRAEDDARSKAVSTAGGYVASSMQDVMAQYGNTSYQFVGKYTSSWSEAWVPYERIAPADCSFTGDIYRCVVRIRGKIYLGKPDPNFIVTADKNKAAYFEGESVNLKVSLSKDAYITVLNCDEEGNVTIIFPNPRARDSFLPAGKELNIPDDLPFRLTALLPAGRRETGDLMHVIATKKQPLVMVDTLKEDKNGGFSVYPLGGRNEVKKK